jgi:hypothetical protein
MSAISYRAYLHSAHSSTALKERRRHGKKIQLLKDHVRTVIFRKILFELYKVAIEEHIRVSLFSLAKGKNALCAVG